MVETNLKRTSVNCILLFFIFQAEDGIRDVAVTGVQTCALPIYSTTKGISALVLAALVADLETGYETRVAEIWPEFAAKGKEAVTIGELVSHQAGLPGFVDEIDPELWLDPPACAAAIA